MKFGPETTAKLVEGMRLGMTAKLCCDYAGISESLFYVWRKQAKAGDHMVPLSALQEAQAKARKLHKAKKDKEQETAA